MVDDLEEKGKITSKKVTLSDGSEVGVPGSMIDESVQIFSFVKEQQLLPDEKLSPSWIRFGHRIGNIASQLVAVAALEKTAEQQKERLSGLVDQAIKEKGEEIIPLFRQIGLSV